MNHNNIFVTLPCELRQAILRLLDPESVACALLTCKALHDAFVGNSQDILEASLLKCIDRDLMHDSIVRLRSARMSPASSPTKEQETIKSNYLGRRAQALRTSKWRLSRLIEMQHFHQHIEYFFEEFVTQCAIPTGFGQNSSRLTATTHEIRRSGVVRIQRTFYRYEIFRNLYLKDESIDADRRNTYSAMLEEFSPWETEQLHCVNDFLITAMLPVVQTLSVHNPEWIAWLSFMGKGVSRWSAEHLITHKGLANAHSILLSTQSERESPQFLNADGDIDSTFFLDHIFTGGYSFNRNTAPLKYLSFLEYQATVSSSAFLDINEGPQQVWEWSHRLDPPVSWIRSLRQRRLRKWAYVMWDKATLDEYGVPWGEDWVPDDREELSREVDANMASRAEVDERAERLIEAGIVERR